MTSMRLEKMELPLFHDDRGDLGVLEFRQYVDWAVKRFYYVTNVTKPRGGHCVKGEKKFYICLKGSCVGKFYDGEVWREFNMKGPNVTVLMEGDFWREFVDFSEDCVLAAVSSLNYDPQQYIMDLGEYERYRSSK